MKKSTVAREETQMQAASHAFGFIHNRIFQLLFAPGILTLMAILIYHPSLNYPFQFDDIANITKRFGIRFDDPLTRWWTSPRWLGDWLNAFNFQLGRFDPFYYRLFNVFIHIFAGLILFYLIYNLCRLLTTKPFFYDNALFIAFVSSGLFLLHPTQTQTVSYVIQARMEGLASLFVLATLLMYVKAIQANNIIFKTIFIALLFTFGLLSCGTKELVVVVPFLMLLIDWFFISQQQWALFKNHLWLYGLFTLFFVILILQHMGTSFTIDALLGKMSTHNNRGNILTPSAFDEITAWTYLISEFKVIVHYLVIFLWPFNISVEYDWKIAPSFFSFEVIIPLAILVTLLVMVFRSVWYKKYVAFSFGMLWFLIAVAPRASIIPSPELVCDYKTYLASAGMMFLLSTIIVYLFTTIWAAIRTIPAQFNTYEVKVGVLSILMLFIGLGAYQRNKIWETCVVFWEDNIKKAPNKARSHNNLGVALSEAGRVDESIVAYQKAISLDANYADPLSNLAVAYSMKGEIDKAIEALKGAINICPNYPEAYNNLGTLLLQKKQYDDAERMLTIAIQLRPYYGKAFYNFARLYEEKGESAKAWDYLKKATEGDLDTPEAMFKLGQLGLKVQKYDEAIHAFEETIRRGAGQDQVWFNLANAHFLCKHLDKAQEIYAGLAQKNPNDVRYMYNLAETLYTKNEFANACEIFKRTTTFPQPVPQAFFRVAQCYEQMKKFKDAQQYLNGLLSLNTAEEFKKTVRNEITRLALQEKVIEGKGSIKLSDFKKAIALNKDPNAPKTTKKGKGGATKENVITVKV